MPYDIIVGRNESDKKLFGKRGLAFIGKTYVKMGQFTSLSNPLYMDVARSHVVLICGKRGSGKCLTGDSLITLDDGSLLPIQQLEENNNKIFALGPDLKIDTAPKAEFFKRTVDTVLLLKTRSGKEIKLTPEHPLFTIKGWIPAQELTIGSRIATPRRTGAFGKGEMPLEKVKLLSYLIAEGHTKKVVSFSNSDERIVSEFKEAVSLFDSKLEVVEDQPYCYRIVEKNFKTKITNMREIIKNEKTGRFEKGSKVEHEKRSIRQLIEKQGLFGKLSKEKTLSQEILRLNKPLLSLFLNRLFSCDGSIFKVNDYWQISYASSSNMLIRQVQSLLLRYGILSKIRTKHITLDEKQFKSYELIINAENSIHFIKDIGFFGSKFEKSIVALQEIKSKIRNPNIDTIPKEIWETFQPKSWAALGRAIGYKHPKAMRERIHYAPSRSTLLQIAEIEQSTPLQKLAMSDIFWDEIMSIEIKEGTFEVYDFHVPKIHNFVANDIIVHNSYTIGSMAESLSSMGTEEAKNISPIIFDTMGIFWTMKYKNEKEMGLLSEWNATSKNIPVRVFAPFGHFQSLKEKGIGVDKEFAIKVSELEPQDWISLFNLSFTEGPAIAIENAVGDLKKSMNTYGFENVIEKIRSIPQIPNQDKNAAIALFHAARTWGVFDEKKGTEIKDLLVSGETTVIDLSMYSSMGVFNIRALVIGLVSKKIFEERLKARKLEEIKAIHYGENYLGQSIDRETPLVWIFIDEAHEFLPREGKTPASDALVQILREGRQPGISLVLATQQPGKIHTDAITQSDLVISHRLTAKADVEALNEITQSYLYDAISKKLNDLPSLKGSAILLDDNSERIYPMRIRPRFTWHGGESPSAIPKESEL